MYVLRYIYVLLIITGTIFLYLFSIETNDFFYLLMVFADRFFQIGVLSLLVTPTLFIFFIFVLRSIYRNPYMHGKIDNDLIVKFKNKIEQNNEIFYCYTELKNNKKLDTQIVISKENNELIVRIKNSSNTFKNYFTKIEDVIRFLECNTSVKVNEFD